MYNGMVTQVLAGIYPKCEIDASAFPFDKHLCTFLFYSIIYTMQEVVLIPLQDHINLELYTSKENYEWDVDETSTDLVLPVPNGGVLNLGLGHVCLSAIGL